MMGALTAGMRIMQALPPSEMARDRKPYCRSFSRPRGGVRVSAHDRIPSYHVL